MIPRSDPSSSPLSPAISLLDVAVGMARRKLMIVATALVAFGIGMAIATLVKPTYSTEAQVLIENLETPYDQVQGAGAPPPAGSGVDDRVVASQMSVIRSEDLGRRVVAALGLQDNPEFNALIKGLGPTARLKLMLGFGDDPRRMSPEQRALATYLDELSVYQVPSSNVIGIKYTAADPQTAAKVANTLAETYVVATRENQSAPTERARDWLARQIDTLRDKLARAEQAVEEFRSKAGLLQGATTTLGTQQVSELTTQITIAQNASAEAAARADAIRQILAGKGSLESSAEVQASPIIQRLKEQRTEAQRVLAELTPVYLPNHPKMIAAQAQITNIDRQIRAEALKVAAGLDEQARITKSRELALRASLDQLKGQESTANLSDVKLKALEREAAADRALLETMMSRYAEASARNDAAAQPGLARIIQTATPPAAPTFPKRGPLVLLVTLAGLTLGLGLAFLAEIMAAAARLSNPGIAARPASVAAAAPVSTTEPATMVSAAAAASPSAAPAAAVEASPASPPSAPEQPIASALRALVAAEPAIRLPSTGSPVEALHLVGSKEVVEAGRQLAGWWAGLRRQHQVKTVAIVATGAASGDTSLAAVTMARAAAATAKVIIVDLDRQGSLLESLTGVAQGQGILDLMAGTAGFTKVIGRDVKSAAHLLRFGKDRSPATFALLDARIDSVLAALVQTYDLVIVHAGEASLDSQAAVNDCQAGLVLAPASRGNEATALIAALCDAGAHAARHVLVDEPAAASKDGQAAVA